MKSNTRYETIKSLSIPKNSVNILADEIIQLSSKKAKIDCPTNLRRIVFKRETDGKTLVFITNDLDRTAEEIAELYKQRWQIELFFKWIKQNLKIKTFLGQSENAVLIQVLVAMIAYLLLKLTQLHTKTKYSLQQIAWLFRVNISQRISMMKLLFPDKNSNKTDGNMPIIHGIQNCLF